MFCTKCGSELSNGASFCPRCGARVATVSSAAVREGNQGGNEESGLHAAPVSQNEPSAKKPRKKSAAIAAVVAVAVVCAAIGLGVWWKMDQDAKAAAEQAKWERAHATLITKVPIEAPDFDDNSTSIPVQIVGTDLDGNEVNEVQFMRPSSTQVTMLQGSYDLTFPGGYLTGGGQVAKSQGATAHVDVFVEDVGDASDAGNPSGSAGGSTSAGSTASSNSSANSSSQSSDVSSQNGDEPAATVEQPVVYVLVNPLDVTDEDIADVVRWVEQDPEDNGKAEQLRQGVMVKRDEAIAEKKRQEEEAAERARVEARKAEITQTAEDFLYYLYDYDGSRGKSLRSSRPATMGGFTNGGSLQSGWPATRMVSVNSIEAIDENTVVYSVTYDSKMMTNPWEYGKQDNGTIVFGENGLIDQWYPVGSPNGRLV